jgi:hypothetical protein
MFFAPSLRTLRETVLSLASNPAILYFRFEFFDLRRERLGGEIGGRLERARLFFGKKLVARYLQFYFHCFILNAFIIESEENLSIHQPVIKRFQFIEFALNEINQPAIGNKVNGMNLEFHKK